MRRTALALLAAITVVAALRVAPAAARAAHPPIVMLVGDEFSWSALLNAKGQIDATRYPNIAKLARTADVFNRYTAPGDETGPVMTTLLAGEPYRPGADPGYASHPSNLFTRLARTYRMVVNEEVTGFCPARICPGNHPPASRQQSLSRIAHGRTNRVEAWIRRIHHTDGPAFFFKHSILPHGPAVYLPSGQRYNPNPFEPIRGLNLEGSFGDPWFVRQSWQRYLLQVELVDRLVGRTIARLKATRMYDRSAILLTADNGEAFGFVGSDPHRTDGQTAVDVAATPFILKLPGQRTGRVIQRHVRTIDVMPSLLRLGGLSTRGLPGRNMLAPHQGIPAGFTIEDDAGRVRSFSRAAFDARFRAILHRKAVAFTHGIFGIGPAHGLVGRKLATLKVGRARGLNAVFAYRDLLAHVNPRGFVVPADIVAQLRGRRIGRGVAFAVAVNGTIAATGSTALIKGNPTPWATALVPPAALRRGKNDVAILLVGRHGELSRVP